MSEKRDENVEAAVGCFGCLGILGLLFIFAGISYVYGIGPALISVGIIFVFLCLLPIFKSFYR